MKQACDMVHKEEFTASVTSLGLLESMGDLSSLPNGSPSGGASTSKGIPVSQKTKYVQVSDIYCYLRHKGTIPLWFSAIFTKGNSFCEFLFA